MIFMMNFIKTYFEDDLSPPLITTNQLNIMNKNCVMKKKVFEQVRQIC